jgi:hypothetical protein
MLTINKNFLVTSNVNLNRYINFAQNICFQFSFFLLKLINHEPNLTIWSLSSRFFLVTNVFFLCGFLWYIGQNLKKVGRHVVRLELVDDGGDWRELREDDWHCPGVLASQMTKRWLKLTVTRIG